MREIVVVEEEEVIEGRGGDMVLVDREAVHGKGKKRRVSKERRGEGRRGEETERKGKGRRRKKTDPAVSPPARKTPQLLPLHLFEHPRVEVMCPVVHVLPWQSDPPLSSTWLRGRSFGEEEERLGGKRKANEGKGGRERRRRRRRERGRMGCEDRRSRC